MGRRFFLRSVVLGDVLLLVAAILLATYRVFRVWAPWLVTTPSGSLMPSVVLVLVGAALSLYGSYLAWGRTVPRPSYGRAVVIVAATMAFTAVGLVVTRSYWSREWLITVSVLWLVFAIVQRFIARRRPWTESMVVITSEKVLADDLGNSAHADVIAIVDPLGDPHDVPLVDGGTLVVDLREVLSEDMARYVSSASVSGQRVRPLVDVYEEHTGRLPLVHIVGGWELTRPVQRSHYAGAKRVIDVVAVILTLPLWILLWGIVWVVVKIDSSGPAIYSQERVGRNGSTFTLYKFRTMVRDAERDGPQFTSEDDPRITRTGRFLRKSRLDEIPQLWNVLMGDVAVVGPRPERPVFVDQFSRTIPFYDSRLLIRPGVTGWAQVHYGYADGEADTVEKLTYDLYYVKHSSLWLDVHILGMSVWTVLTGNGAR
jgi:lipopolysaccharide/colanic/teichoic acid biosynthesis glycosyltransferase